MNPAFVGSQELLIDSPSARHDEIAMDMDGDLSLEAEPARGSLPTGRFPSGHLQGLDGSITVESPPAPQLNLTGQRKLVCYDKTLI